MSRSEGRTGEYERDERARDIHVDRYVSESDRLSSRRPWSLNEDGRDCDPSLMSHSQQHTPRLIIWVVCHVEHHSEASHP